MACLVLMDLSIPVEIQGFCNCFCLLLETCLRGACLFTIDLSVSIVLGCCLMQIITLSKDNIPVNSRDIVKISFRVKLAVVSEVKLVIRLFK